MKHIRFKYMDEYSHGKWSYQECTCESIDEMIEFYGLNECEWEIVSIESDDE